MLRLRTILLALALPAVLSAAPQDAIKKPAVHARAKGFVGCTATKIFHRPSCKMVKAIEEAGTKVTFTTRAEAIQAGYKPCEDCKP